MSAGQGQGRSTQRGFESSAGRLLVIALLLLARPLRSQPIWPLLTPSPGDTLLVLERLAAREGLPREALGYRVYRCLPDGRIEAMPPIAVDPRVFTADRDSLVRVAKSRQGVPDEGLGIRWTVELCLLEDGNADTFSAERSCYDLSRERWILFRRDFAGGILLYDPRAGTATIRDTKAWRLRLLPDHETPPIAWGYGSERNNFGLGVLDLDGSGRHLGGVGFEAATYFFQAAPAQSAVILVYNYFIGPSEMDARDRYECGRPLSLLRFDRPSFSLPEVVTLPPCRELRAVSVDDAGRILLVGKFVNGERLYRIDTRGGFGVVAADSTPVRNGYLGWSLSDASRGRVLVAAARSRISEELLPLEVRLYDCATLRTIWSGSLPGRSAGLGSLRLAGDRLLVAWSMRSPPLPDQEANAHAYDVRWDLYTLTEDEAGLRFLPDSSAVEFSVGSSEAKRRVNEPSILAAVDGLGFLAWRGDSLVWQH